MVRLCALALVLMTSDGACAQSWPSRPIRAIVPYTCRRRHRHRLAYRRAAAFAPARLSDRHREPARSRRRHRHRGSGQADPDGHHHLLTASSHTISPWAYSRFTLRHGGRPRRDYAACQSAQRACGRARRRTSDRRRRSLPPHGQARQAQLRIGRKRQRDPPQCRAVSPQRRVRRRARSIQGRTGGAGRSDERSRGFRVQPDLAVAAVHPRGKAVALGVSTSTRISPARRADDDRGRVRQFRLQFWVGMFVPAKTPREVVERLHRETARVLKSPEIQAKLFEFRRRSDAHAAHASSTPMFATRLRPTRCW